MDEVVHVLVHRRTNTFGYGHKVSGTEIIYKGRSSDDDFSHDALNRWLDECRDLAYRPGLGTWTTAEVHVFPYKPGRVDFLDEEHLQRDPDGDWYPAAAQLALILGRSSYLHIPEHWAISRRDVGGLPS
ncbi:hypothetical protein QFZ23_002347 [Arthrobacter globiformis]|uniref:hypothetical protein n=1 Tax=Arthrobacter globiformis TaxID=1665 RepID=UPI002782D550|nr:hypothetical protein [Arthrobacter globiformis]MDQ1058446.1 hypothetical protein [Arthrobacter globiformis]